MFGPDKCGTETKYHFIVRFKNPVTGKYEEKHAKKSQLPDHIFSDGNTHLFTLSTLFELFSFFKYFDILIYIKFKLLSQTTALRCLLTRKKSTQVVC